jgi:hypothetical protein
MSFIVRFLASDPRSLVFSDLARAVQRADGRFRLAANPRAMGTEAQLIYGQSPLASLTLLPKERCTELLEDVAEQVLESAPGGEGDQVRRRIASTTWVLLVELLGGGIDAQATLERLDPLISYVMAERLGMLWVEGEGFYDASGPILPLGW